MGEAAEETGKREEADLCDAAPLLASVSLKIAEELTIASSPLLSPRSTSSASSCWPVGRTATSIGGGTRSRPGCRAKATRRGTAGSLLNHAHAGDHDQKFRR